MSNKTLFMKSGFVRAPLQLGIGRYVPQLQRITFKFCKSHGSSRGMRDYIEQDLLDFAKENPGVVVYVKPRRHRSPVIVAEYLNGDRVWMNFFDKNNLEIKKFVEVMRTQASDISSIRYRKMQFTEYPSVQGPWNPFVFKDPGLNSVQFPANQFSINDRLPMSATEILKRMFEEQKTAIPESSTEPKQLEEEKH